MRVEITTDGFNRARFVTSMTRKVGGRPVAAVNRHAGGSVMRPAFGGPPSHRLEAGTEQEPVAAAAENHGLTGLHALASVSSADDALLAARNKLTTADNRLAQAHEEAQSIIRDAVAQANLLTSNATHVAERLLADAEHEAAQVRAEAEDAVRTIHADAEQRRAGADAAARALHEQTSADLLERRRLHDQQLEAERTAHAEQLARLAAGAERDKADLAASASAAADQLLAEARHERSMAQAETEAGRRELARQVDEQLSAARAEASRELAAAAEQTVWAQEIMRRLLEAAELDADGIRARAHLESGAAVRRTRGQVAALLAASRERLRERVERVNREATEVTRRSDDAFAQALRDADTVRDRASVDADRIIRTAEAEAQEHTARAERRLAEAEAGAKTIREQVAVEVTRTQEELHDRWRTSKTEQGAAAAAARAEADEVRNSARRLLSDARAEVALLSQRRDAIAAELGSLSGVIEALAVAESQPPAPPPAKPTPPPAESAPAPTAIGPAPTVTAPSAPPPSTPVPRPPTPAHRAEDPYWKRPEESTDETSDDDHDDQVRTEPISLLDEMMRSE
jgi:hypothetical protein